MELSRRFKQETGNGKPIIEISIIYNEDDSETVYVFNIPQEYECGKFIKIPTPEYVDWLENIVLKTL